MITQGLLEQGFKLMLWLLSWFPVVSLPTVDLTPLWSVMQTANGIVPVSALLLAMSLGGSVWAGRGLMLVIRWVVKLVRG